MSASPKAARLGSRGRIRLSDYPESVLVDASDYSRELFGIGPQVARPRHYHRLAIAKHIRRRIADSFG